MKLKCGWRRINDPGHELLIEHKAWLALSLALQKWMEKP